ncbi:HEPN domain-containing protein [Cellulophaga lytica]|uniref:hypothetical protein n=1 Tax=Cellulophaga lytica TaxID=979 RepID=UPI000B5C20A5|nr:hypothetical protein [Cellulophaga lytica]SNQ42325.1 conserved hypothetical protein [Cellulophaga lytica]
MSKNLRIHIPIQYYSAKGFYKNGRILAEQLSVESKVVNNTKVYELISVATVNYSFAVELYLKLLIEYTTGHKKSGHNLEVLFKMLKDEIKLQIEEKYIKKKKIKNPDLKAFMFSMHSCNERDSSKKSNIANLSLSDLLRVHNSSFVEWRYLYEINSEEYYYYEYNFKLMDDFITSLIEVIKEHIDIIK